MSSYTHPSSYASRREPCPFRDARNMARFQRLSNQVVRGGPVWEFFRRPSTRGPWYDRMERIHRAHEQRQAFLDRIEDRLRAAVVARRRLDPVPPSERSRRRREAAAEEDVDPYASRRLDPDE